jgi:cytochrome c oxidase subunit 3/cytochrome o ubiquinol oxidase subunit 3
MNATTGSWAIPSRGRVAMLGLIVTESAFFTIFVTAYLFYIGKSLGGPTPHDVLQPPIGGSIALLSSSVTIALAVRALRGGRMQTFCAWWLTTLGLGLGFLLGTAKEWERLIARGVTIRTNLFGTTYYALVGLHAAHVTVGLLLIALVLAFALRGYVATGEAERTELLSWYWHFVDAVWVVVFTTVYLIGR